MKLGFRPEHVAYNDHALTSYDIAIVQALVNHSEHWYSSCIAIYLQTPAQWSIPDYQITLPPASLLPATSGYPEVDLRYRICILRSTSDAEFASWGRPQMQNLHPEVDLRMQTCIPRSTSGCRIYILRPTSDGWVVPNGTNHPPGWWARLGGPFVPDPRALLTYDSK